MEFKHLSCLELRNRHGNLQNMKPFPFILWKFHRNLNIHLHRIFFTGTRKTEAACWRWCKYAACGAIVAWERTATVQHQRHLQPSWLGGGRRQKQVQSLVVFFIDSAHMIEWKNQRYSTNYPTERKARERDRETHWRHDNHLIKYHIDTANLIKKVCQFSLFSFSVFQTALTKLSCVFSILRFSPAFLSCNYIFFLFLCSEFLHSKRALK